MLLALTLTKQKVLNYYFNRRLKMNFKKGLAIGLAAFGLSLSTQASEINVGGVVWDPDNTFQLFTDELTDFFAAGNLIETATTGVGSTVTGVGKFARVNYGVNNEGDFCPGCDLTFEFSMLTSAINPKLDMGGNPVLDPISGLPLIDFEFSGLELNIYVDNAQNYVTGDVSTVTDGTLWLSLAARGLLIGTGTNIGTGSDTGTGVGSFDVTGGLAEGNFDTNTKVGGTDFTFSSSFQPILDGQGQPTGFLSGGFELSGNSIPEPASIALLGLGLLGFAASRKRKA